MTDQITGRKCSIKLLGAVHKLYNAQRVGGWSGGCVILRYIRGVGDWIIRYITKDNLDCILVHPLDIFYFSCINMGIRTQKLCFC